MNPEQDNFYEKLSEEVVEDTAETPRPNLLDVCKIDGRWAQCVIGGDSIQWLDNPPNSPERINWNDYQLVRKWRGVSVKLYRQYEPAEISDEQVQKIHFGPEEVRDPDYYKQQVRVFGEYKKKENSG
ncbi:MAG: hypothetical protein AAB592_01950 [Patescibacteria group bacterium]